MNTQALPLADTGYIDQALRIKRALCVRCSRAQRACICHCAQAVTNVVDVLILQHPQEAKHIKSSGRLLQLCLQRSRLEIAERFDEAELARWLSADNKQPYLLYPDEQTNGDMPAQTKNALPELGLAAVEQIRLVVIDASWRQSRKILRDHPLLQALPRYSLREMPPSRYVIRQAHQVDQLSSLEACAYALMRLEKNEQNFLALLHAFDSFNQMQIAFGVQRLQRR